MLCLVHKPDVKFYDRSICTKLVLSSVVYACSYSTCNLVPVMKKLAVEEKLLLQCLQLHLMVQITLTVAKYVLPVTFVIKVFVALSEVHFINHTLSCVPSTALLVLQ